ASKEYSFRYSWSGRKIRCPGRPNGRARSAWRNGGTTPTSFSSQLEEIGEPRRHDLRARGVLPRVGPGPHPLLGLAEEAALQLIDIFFHVLEVACPAPRLRGSDALVALPAHAVEQQGTVRRDEPARAAREEQERRRGAFAEHDRRGLVLAVAQEGEH